MWGDAQYFRERAMKCRRLMESARTEEDRRILSEMADELDAEAESLEADKQK